MRGVVEGYEPYRSGMFWIITEDGTEYFSHKRFIASKSNGKKYLYNGNHATFDIMSEDERNHDTAINVMLDPVEDPDAELRKQRREEHARNVALSEIRKEKTRMKQLEERVRYYQKLEMKVKYEMYVIQTHEDGDWTFATRNGKLIAFNDAYRAIDYTKEHRGPGKQIRAIKAKVVKTKDGWLVTSLSTKVKGRWLINAEQE